ncbi:MAG: acyltransferase family protein [Candidatus Accumulibacter necessarius]|jgi:peptidoglycan/LPS O-acetylase OafA/YrhL
MRRDIQLLRGVAVIFVVLYHAKLGILNHGYLGVDVFFVLSGFLITKIILEGLDKGNFSFLHFYIRRAKRLLPALYATLLVTTVVAHLILTPDDRKDFAAQLIGSLAFFANMVLPTQIGYFAADAESVPLLHIWSLSLEEQYYFTLPLFLFLIPRQWRLHALIVLLACSFLWCLAWVTSTGSPPFLWRFGGGSRSDWAFYLFPTRAWELLVGSICAWVMLQNHDLRIPALAKWVSLLVILMVSIWGIDSVHPRGNALIAVMATGIIVLGDDKWLPNKILINAIERVGDWSYSIYLVHWPLFVAAHVIFLEQVPATIGVMLAVLAIVVGFLQYRYIETPFRYQWRSPNKLVWQELVIASLALLVAPMWLLISTSRDAIADDRIKEIRKVNYGLTERCEGSFEGKEINKDCVIGNAPQLAVWGDSYAMHLVPGLSVSNPNLVQLTKSVCGPIFGLAPLSGRYNENWARECLLHNKKAFDYILKSKEVTHVILSSSFNQYFDVQKDGSFLVGNNVVKKSADIAIQHLVETISTLQHANKVPILVSPPPRTGFNIGACLERQERQLFFVRNGCNLTKNEYLEHEASVIDALKRVKEKTGVQLVWISDLLCEGVTCQTQIEDTYVYRDGGHLSIIGSKALLGNWEVEKGMPHPITTATR